MGVGLKMTLSKTDTGMDEGGMAAAKEGKRKEHRARGGRGGNTS